MLQFPIHQKIYLYHKQIKGLTANKNHTNGENVFKVNEQYSIQN